jgi:hypothetical protein
VIKKPDFVKGSPIHLENGAVITPINKTVRKAPISDAMIEYLKKTRWIKCKFQDKCIDALYGGMSAPETYDGFSCESCPHQGKEVGNLFVLGVDRAAIIEDALGCARLWREVHRQGRVV